jgi:hypothetical protein
MIYYHLSAVLHPIGAVLQPGNWGRKLDCSRYRNPSGHQLTIEGFNEPWRLASEMTLEAIRAAEFNDRPSRLSCVFVMDGLKAVDVCRTYLGANPYLYEVELQNPIAKTFVADFSLLNGANRFSIGVDFLPNNRNIARKYWAGDSCAVAEILTESPIVIRKQLSE